MLCEYSLVRVYRFAFHYILVGVIYTQGKRRQRVSHEVDEEQLDRKQRHIKIGNDRNQKEDDFT